MQLSVCVVTASLLFKLDNYFSKMPQESTQLLLALQRFYFFGLRICRNWEVLAPAQQPWPWIAFALADMFIQMNIKSSFSLGLLLFFCGVGRSWSSVSSYSAYCLTLTPWGPEPKEPRSPVLGASARKVSYPLLQGQDSFFPPPPEVET